MTKQYVPMKYKGTQLVVLKDEGQVINPEKEYLRQRGITKKQLKKERIKRLKSKKHD